MAQPAGFEPARGNSSTKTSAISIANTTIISIAMMPVTSSAKKTIKISVVQIQSVVQK